MQVMFPCPHRGRRTVRGADFAPRRLPWRCCIQLDTIGQYVRVILRSGEFHAWLSALADAKGKARILARLRSAAFGNFGDCESVGEGVSEMRVHVGPGYINHESKDITRAKIMARAIRENKP